MKETATVPAIEEEFLDVRLSDARLNKRLVHLAARVASAPSQGFPQVMVSDSELEALYRFLGNGRVEWTQVLEPHVAATGKRCAARGTVIVAHDTSRFAFGGKGRVDAVGHLEHGHPGFFGHFALAVSADPTRTPLGVLGMQIISRGPAEELGATERRMQDRETPFSEKESSRWTLLVKEVADRLPPKTEAIHVMDREADDYELLAGLLAGGHRFVGRAAGNRLLHWDHPSESTPRKLQEALAQLPDVLFRTVDLGHRVRRPGNGNRNHPARANRPATLHMRAASLALKRPDHLRNVPNRLVVNVIQVFEPSPPPGEEPITWTLMTTEPIETAEQRAGVVDAYRARWRIEEFFKALKTGCAYEKRQLESERALLNALALLVPIAWRLLVLRDVAMNAPDTSAKEVLTAEELKLLRVISKRVVLPKEPTARDVLLAIAGLGGHLKRNGDPGWQVLGRGYEALVMAYAGWLAAKARCDQS